MKDYQLKIGSFCDKDSFISHFMIKIIDLSLSKDIHANFNHFILYMNQASY